MKTLTREQFNSKKSQFKQPKVMTRAEFNAKSNPKVMTRAEFEAKKQPQSGGFWRRVGNQLIKPVSAASNLLEDTGKSIGLGVAKLIKPSIDIREQVKKQGIDFLGHQRDVFQGKNQRTYSDIMKDIASQPGNVEDVPLATAMRTIGYAGDIALDPLNKLKVLGLTGKGEKLAKTGSLALSAGEQASKGQRALVQLGKYNVTPNIINKAVLGGATKLNDVIRGTKAGSAFINAGSKISSKIRPVGVSREEFKTITDQTRAFKKATEYAKTKAIELAADIESGLRKKGADTVTRSAILHAVEKGDVNLVPKGYEDIYNKAVAFKNANEVAWKQAGGETLEGYGLAHVATDEVVENAPKNTFGGGKMYSPNTPQDIHRKWMKVDGKIVNLGDEGITYSKTKGFIKNGKPVKVTQASAREINEALVKQGKQAIFKEDLPTSVARMGISTGKKQAGQNFIKNTANITSDKGLQIINETYQKLTNNESVNKALKAYDKVLGIWKKQVLVAPSYHVRNEVGNLWNNYLAGTSPLDYANAAKIQKGIISGNLDDASKILVNEMEQQGVIGGSQYGKDITQTISDEIGGSSWNPLSNRFGLYRANQAVGTTFEDNARIAHYLSKRREGYSAIEAAKSVDKFLFDYGDLTWIEQNILKRAMPFYTWTSKNIPLQLEQFVKNPGKFSKIAVIQKDIEKEIPRPVERYMSDYLKNNSPMRISVDKDGNTQYLLLGQWIPSVQAIQFLSQPVDEILRQITPMVTIPSDLWNNKSFFKDTLGESEKIEKYPGELGTFFGLDMRKKVVNTLKGIRVLNEIDKLNPGEIFGGKQKPSIFQGILPNASENRGTQHSPDSSQWQRVMGFLLGKTTNYNPENSKIFYDKNTQDRMAEYTQRLNQAIRLQQPDLAKDIIREMEMFQSEREGKPNKNIQNYNLLGDRYLEDLARNKQAEFNRDRAREQMKEMLRQGVTSGNTKLVRDAMSIEPEYGKQALKQVIKEIQESKLSDENKKKKYEYEQSKTKFKLNPFYTK